MRYSHKQSMLSVFVSVSCLVVIQLWSCAPVDRESETGLTTVKVGIIPIAEVAQLYVGIDKGFFARHGIELDLVPMAGGAKILEVLGPNGVDIGFSNIVSLILFRSHDRPFLALGGGTYETPQNINHALLVPANSDVMTAADLAGKTIAVNTLKNIEDLMMRRFLESHNVNPDGVHFQAVPFPVMPTALARGDIDAIAVVEPFISIALKENNARILEHQYLALTDRAMVATYVTYEDWISENPRLVQEFLTAFLEATEYMNTHPGETRRIIGNFTNIEDQLLQEIGLPEMVAEIDVDMLDSLARDLHERGWAARRVSSSEVLYRASVD